MSSDKLNHAELARELAKTTVDNIPEVANKDVLSIELRYGYDIGVWSKWSNSSHAFDPMEFTELD
ncbi:hypothetical protein [Agarivorans gilvus]|uniref:Uncharacterized protein n=1 Tax=Agarivorans gilvus TaxID=680279 RepID=A0ABQ1I9H6_9ALTE|nr:hypothetical protein [Agarivorans gilvus]GGB21880.1 hypothetical protein GCM10007414_39090 [Agarivorans gilvus]